VIKRRRESEFLNIKPKEDHMTEEQFLAEFIALRDQFPKGKFVQDKELYCGDHRFYDREFHNALPDIETFAVTWDGQVERPPRRREHYLETYDTPRGPVSLKMARSHPLSDEELRDVILTGVRVMLGKYRASIAQGAATRKRRREAQLKKVINVWLRDGGDQFANQEHCACCRKLLTDPESHARGIGPECWEFIKQELEARQAKQVEAA
jgi:hypothetical protein